MKWILPTGNCVKFEHCVSSLSTWTRLSPCREGVRLTKCLRFDGTRSFPSRERMWNKRLFIKQVQQNVVPLMRVFWYASTIVTKRVNEACCLSHSGDEDQKPSPRFDTNHESIALWNTIHKKFSTFKRKCYSTISNFSHVWPKKCVMWIVLNVEVGFYSSTTTWLNHWQPIGHIHHRICTIARRILIGDEKDRWIYKYEPDAMVWTAVIKLCSHHARGFWYEVMYCSP